MTIGERIKIIREESEPQKMSMAQFATRLGVTSGAVSQWENGQKIPQNSTIIAICKEFFINEEWLRTGNGSMQLNVRKEAEVARIAAQMYKDATSKDESNNIRYELQKVISELSDEDALRVRNKVIEVALSVMTEEELGDALRKIHEKNLPD